MTDEPWEEAVVERAVIHKRSIRENVSVCLNWQHKIERWSRNKKAFVKLHHIFQCYNINKSILSTITGKCKDGDFHQWLAVQEVQYKKKQDVTTEETSLLTRINELWGVVKGVVCCVVRRVNPSICFTLYEEKYPYDRSYMTDQMSSVQSSSHMCKLFLGDSLF